MCVSLVFGMYVQRSLNVPNKTEKSSCSHLGLSENRVNLPNEIAIFHRDNDQQNHWVQWGLASIFRHTHFDDIPRSSALRHESSESRSVDPGSFTPRAPARWPQSVGSPPAAGRWEKDFTGGWAYIYIYICVCVCDTYIYIYI